MLHRNHGIGSSSISLLDAVDMFAGFGEDVWVLWGREDTVEVGLVETFANLEDCVGGGRGSKGKLVRGCADNGTIFAVKVDVVLLILACPNCPCWRLLALVRP